MDDDMPVREEPFGVYAVPLLRRVPPARLHPPDRAAEVLASFQLHMRHSLLRTAGSRRVHLSDILGTAQHHYYHGRVSAVRGGCNIHKFAADPDCVPESSKVAVVGCMGFAMTFCIGSIDIFENWFFLRDFEVGLFLFSIVIVMVAHVLITNDNFELLRLDDTMLVAFVLFVYYMLFLVGCRIAAHCIDANIDYYYPDEGKATTEIFKSVISIL